MNTLKRYLDEYKLKEYKKKHFIEDAIIINVDSKESVVLDACLEDYFYF